MHKVAWLGPILLWALLSTSDALRCYHCSNCHSEVGTPMQCNYGYDVCMKVTIVGRVEKACGRKSVCGFGPTKRGVVTSWNRLQNLLSDVNTDLLRIPDGMEASSVMCCTSDHCNSASSTSLSLFLLLLLIFLVHLMWY
ncbi:hypothetical protein SK128_002435 [Halocaridina rubra]|uniref:Uncharacterized protein n=1 Tax=Halocaridina rubra TaxID=373956 RepID=A0AAN8XHF5_HALRR